ncbi:hypothetical protein TNCV_3914431 [Trichonephila clavipes]|nr:hypothetical protein TNCV_3914431 [Trichonephila clavipes]
MRTRAMVMKPLGAAYPLPSEQQSPVFHQMLRKIESSSSAPFFLDTSRGIGLRCSTDIMGRMIGLLAGDFLKTLPVIQRGMPADEIRACIKSSNLWATVEKFSLKTI